jgi:hypothetical protein
LNEKRGTNTTDSLASQARKHELAKSEKQRQKQRGGKSREGGRERFTTWTLSHITHTDAVVLVLWHIWKAQNVLIFDHKNSWSVEIL